MGRAVGWALSLLRVLFRLPGYGRPEAILVGKGCWLSSLPEWGCRMGSVVAGVLGHACWMDGTGAYAQQLGRAANLLSCPCDTVEWAPLLVQAVDWAPNQVELPVNLKKEVS